VSVVKRRKESARVLAKMTKKGGKVFPVQIIGRAIAKTFWGKAWCDHLESFSDYENRLPRGRTYVRNGSVIHLGIEKGKIEALVQGSRLYKTRIDIKCVNAKHWQKILENCSGEIDSVIELLQGKLSSSVMKTITDRHHGLFPKPNEITLECSCPDWAEMCKHVAAVLYGVGARLDESPELLFRLRHVDHLEFINNVSLKAPAKRASTAKTIKGQDLSKLFGIEIDTGDVESTPSVTTKSARSQSSTKKGSTPY